MITLPYIEALGTNIEIEIFDSLSKQDAQTTYEGLRFLIKQFEQKYSHFSRLKNESIICNLNDSGFLLEPDQTIIDLLQFGLQLYHQTNGVFNMLATDTLERNGYQPIYSSTPIIDSDNIIDPTQVLSISKEKILLAKGHIDISGFSKGFLIDLIVQDLKNTYQITEFSVSCRGSKYATTKHNQPLKIFLEHPSASDVILAETTIKNEGFAMSSTFKRTDNAHHIIDTRTGESHNNALGVFIKAPNAALADAWATTLLISAPDNHLLALENHLIKVATYSEQEKKFKEWGKFF